MLYIVLVLRNWNIQSYSVTYGCASLISELQKLQIKEKYIKKSDLKIWGYKLD